MKWVWPPLINALEKRQQEIKDGLDAADKAKKNLEIAKSSSAEALRNAKIEAQKIIDEANKQRSIILDKAEVEANEAKQRILENAQSQIEAEYNKARENLRAEAVALAVAGAEKILSQKVDSKSDQEMVKKIIESL